MKLKDSENLKRSIRQSILEQRKALTAEENLRLSGEVVSRFLAASRFPAMAVGFYKATKTELNLAALEEQYRRLGARILFPRLAHESKAMELVEISDGLEMKWTSGHYGIAEPDSALQPFPANQVQMIFVPGVAFGEKGERLGRGRGHYDRYLVRAPKALRVALCFDFQLMEELPQDEWDQPVHWIVTEKREIQMPYVEEWRKSLKK